MQLEGVTKMLNEITLERTIDDSTYKNDLALLKEKLAQLQRDAKDRKIPVIIVFEGFETSGKGTMINELLLPLDPRGFNAYFIHDETEEEKMRPFLWRYWLKTPSKGRIAIFDQSWYRRVSVETLTNTLALSSYEKSFEDISSFEKQLADDGVLIIKLFLHINKKEQKKRLEALEANDSTAWKVNKATWKMNKDFEVYLDLFEKMIQRTDTEYAPWTVIESNHKKFAKLKMFSTVVDALERKIASVDQKMSSKENASTIVSASDENRVASSILKETDLSKFLTKEQYQEELKICQKRIREIEYEIYSKRIPIMIAYEGWDAAGKGGNIKRMVENCDPRGYEVIPIASPTSEEKEHHYLWRFWNKIPKAGHISIFDRTWYGRVLVERIEGFCTEEEWKRAYREINEMEKQLTNFGVILVKFWLHIDQEEQLRRFEERQNTPSKSYKITEEDWRNRERWSSYETAVDEMLLRTSTTYAPWIVIESNDKYFARIKALKSVIAAAEKQL